MSEQRRLDDTACLQREHEAQLAREAAQAAAQLAAFVAETARLQREHEDREATLQREHEAYLAREAS